MYGPTCLHLLGQPDSFPSRYSRALPYYETLDALEGLGRARREKEIWGFRGLT
jgi:hypothetical protein